MQEKVKLRAGQYMFPVVLTFVGNRIKVAFGYNKILLEEIKMMEGAKWHGFDDPPDKVWSITNSLRNNFVLAYLKGGDPYAFYDKELEPVMPVRNLRKHQVQMFQFAWTRRRCVLGAEMGTGKTLVFIELAERMARDVGPSAVIWYVGPVAGVKAVSNELIKWKCQLNVKMMTYNGLTTIVKNWKPGDPAPHVLCLDESSKCKTHTSQRTQAAMHVANAVNSEQNGLVILMTGSPAPKNPIDWWSQAEVACPGFIKEGHPAKLGARLSLMENREGVGGAYPHRITWLDDDRKCAVCGDYATGDKHTTPKGDRTVAFDPKVAFSHTAVRENQATEVKTTETYYHKYVPSVNEVAKMYKRLKGLVLIIFKKDCLDLPEKDYRIIRCKPTPDMVRAASIIKKQSPRAITALTLLRELSDGFQYQEVVVGETECALCHGSGEIMGQGDQSGVSGAVGGMIPCPSCNGTGLRSVVEREVIEATSPKDQELIDILDEHEDCGRAVVWGGFNGTIGRLVKLVRAEGWCTLKVDGKGWVGGDHNGNPLDADELLLAMDGSHPRRQELLTKYPKLAFVGSPDSGGMGITLTASPFAVYYSNSFNGESRIQSEDRIHRLGMDQNRSCIIYDLFCLPADELVHKNLMMKKRLQALTMGELQDA